MIWGFETVQVLMVEVTYGLQEGRCHQVSSLLQPQEFYSLWLQLHCKAQAYMSLVIWGRSRIANIVRGFDPTYLDNSLLVYQYK